MPLYKTITPKKNTTIYIWKITESFNDLNTQFLTENSLNRLNGMRSELHQRGFLSIRHLLKVAGYSDDDLYYDNLGKPHLKDGNYISITHSFIFSAIIISSTTQVGIDIEKQRDKILRIAHKFTTTEDYNHLTNDEDLVRKLTIVWGAKESLYKIYEQEGLSFLQHIHVEDFTFDDLQTTATVTFKENKNSYLVYFLEFEGFTCVYAFDELLN
ncbi:MAG: 4'-phosphopantetheinyl transferase superfamily protein [Flavobacteriaceae bacterium]|nr:4'-phosphopantetheinyl transferase superfamily protein [Flavobacteriaceae bacterium]